MNNFSNRNDTKPTEEEVTRFLARLDFTFGAKGMLADTDLRSFAVRKISEESGCVCGAVKFDAYGENCMLDKHQINNFELTYDISHPMLPGLDLQLVFSSSSSEWICMLNFEGVVSLDEDVLSSFKAIAEKPVELTSLDDAASTLYIPDMFKKELSLNSISKSVVIISEYLNHRLNMDQDTDQIIAYSSRKGSWSQISLKHSSVILACESPGFDVRPIEPVFKALNEAAEFFDVLANEPERLPQIRVAMAAAEREAAKLMDQRNKFDKARRSGTDVLNALIKANQKDHQ